jgi:hypothetical protein
VSRETSHVCLRVVCVFGIGDPTSDTAGASGAGLPMDVKLASGACGLAQAMSDGNRRGENVRKTHQ